MGSMIKDRIGQMFMVGFDGHQVSLKLRDIILCHGIGGIILFSRNITDPIQLADLCNDLQNISKDIPLFISIDQEGGRVSRLKEPFTQLPPARFFGRLFEKKPQEIQEDKTNEFEPDYKKDDVVTLLYDLGEVVARELSSVGINMNLAPVLDVNTNPGNLVIKDRSFGLDPFTVSILGNAFIKGLQGNGVIAVGKHFPGHGDTDCDSHKQLPTVKHSVKRFEEVELMPFMESIKEGLESIMTAHVLYPAWDASMPATLSENILDGILRKKMGFEGLIISDDMDMGAIKSKYSIEEATMHAINAGVDIILIGNNLGKLERVMHTTLQAVDKGRISQSRINESVERILGLKNRYLYPYHPADHDHVKSVIGCKQHKEIVDKIKNSNHKRHSSY